MQFLCKKHAATCTLHLFSKMTITWWDAEGQHSHLINIRTPDFHLLIENLENLWQPAHTEMQTYPCTHTSLNAIYLLHLDTVVTNIDITLWRYGGLCIHILFPHIPFYQTATEYTNYHNSKGASRHLNWGLEKLLEVGSLCFTEERA